MDVNNSGFHDTTQDVSRKETIAQVADIYLRAKDTGTRTGVGTVREGMLCITEGREGAEEVICTSLE
jgi:hypothetical protein